LFSSVTAKVIAVNYPHTFDLHYGAWGVQFHHIPKWQRRGFC